MPVATATIDRNADLDTFEASSPTPRRGEEPRRASLRRIAIVLKSLPEPVAESLVASLDSETIGRLRREIARLADVDPMERQRALESFTGSVRRHVRRDGDRVGHDDQLQLSGASPRRSVQGGPGGTSPAAAPEPASAAASLDRLSELANQELLTLLLREHPQTIAVVMASMPPARAAQLIPMMPTRASQEVLARIGRLHDLPSETVREVADLFAARIEQVIADRHHQQIQQWLGPLVSAVAGHAPRTTQTADEVARHVPPSALAVSSRLRAILAELPGGSPAPAAATTIDPLATDAATRLRDATGSIDSSNPASPTQPIHERRNETSAPVLALSTDEIHRHLVELRPKALCEALGHVSTRAAILALCGLPNKTADAAIAILPRAQANQVRSQLASIGSLELREIDEAKQQVVQAAMFRSSSVTGPQLANSPSQRTSSRVAAA